MQRVNWTVGKFGRSRSLVYRTYRLGFVNDEISCASLFFDMSSGVAFDNVAFINICFAVLSTRVQISESVLPEVS